MDVVHGFETHDIPTSRPQRTQPIGTAIMCRRNCKRDYNQQVVLQDSRVAAASTEEESAALNTKRVASYHAVRGLMVPTPFGLVAERNYFDIRGWPPVS